MASKKRKEVKTANRMAAQGDVMFIRASAADVQIDASKEIKPENGRLIVAHSETGHHHTVDATGTKLYQGENENVCYLVMAEGVGFKDVVHHRDWDTHETFRLLGNESKTSDKSSALGKGGDTGGATIWKIQRQSEWSPEGWRRVED